MIGTDTDILLRLWLNDDPRSQQRIDALLAAHGGTPRSFPVTDVVLAEAVRTLKSAFDQVKPAQLLAVGFADCLVVAKHARHGCDFRATLDRGVRKLRGVRVL
jgi:predicted nucleic-acid-binding protein